MQIPRDTMPAEGQDTDWILPCDDLQTDYGVNPEQIPEGAYSVASGIDARSDGQFRRPAGMKLWMDLASSATLREVFRKNVYADKPDWACSFWDIIPFTVYGGASLSTDTGRPESIFGLLLWRPKPQWNSNDPTLYIAWRDDQNRVSPVHSDSGLVTTQSFGVTAVRYHASDSTPWWVPGPVSAVAGGRFLYIGRNQINSPVSVQGLSKPYLTLWYDHNPDTALNITTNQGWRTDFFGVPPKGQLYMGNSVNSTGGYTLTGNYRVAARLVDRFRRRLANATFLKANATDAEQDVPGQAYTAAFAANAGYITAVLNLVTGGYVSSEITANRNRDCWDTWQVLSTLSSGVTTEPGGGTFFVVDEMKTASTWRSGASGTVNTMRAFEAADRDESTNPQHSPATDRGLPGGSAYDFELDDFLDFEELGECHGLTIYKGITVAAACLQVRKSDGTLGPVDSNISLIYSDVRFNGPENFSRPSIYRTKYKPQRQVLFGTTSSNFQQENITRPLVAMVEASNFLYVFGDGPIYRVVRSGTDVQIDELDGGLKPLNRNAVCSFGRGAIILAESGVFALEGSTGTISKLRTLSRLLQDKWTTPELRRNISCAYDSVMDTVYILCPGTAEMVCLSIGTNRITMESGANFTMVRSADLPSISGPHLDKRALFFTWYGKVYYPEYLQADQETSSVGSRYSRHDLTEITTGTGAVLASPVKAHYRVTNANRATVEGVPMILLELAKPLHSSEGSDPGSLSPLHATGTTIGFLSGKLIHQVFPLYMKSTPGAYNNTYVVHLLDNIPNRPLQDFADSLVTLSPAPTLLVGGPLTANRPHEFLAKRHVFSTLPVLKRFQGGYEEVAPYTPVIFAGVCELPAISATEPAPVPSIHLLPTGPLPYWIDLSHPSVVLSPVPRDPNGRLMQYDPEKPWLMWSHLNEQYGVNGAKLLPIFLCVASGLSFDLMEWYFAGRVENSNIPHL